jgi:hypothetical protein
VIGDGQKITVDDMLKSDVSRRIRNMVEQQTLTQRLFPDLIQTRRPLNKRERLARWARHRIQTCRESIALRIAPTLHSDEDCEHW